MHGAAHDNEAAFRHRGAKAFVRCWFLCVNPNHQHSARENSMDNNRREEELIAKLKILNMRIDWIASAEGRAALVKGFGANGEYFKEKMELVEKTEKLLDELTGKK